MKHPNLSAYLILAFAAVAFAGDTVDEAIIQDLDFYSSIDVIENQEMTEMAAQVETSEPLRQEGETHANQ